MPKPIELSYNEIPGVISAVALMSHYDLYLQHCQNLTDGIGTAYDLGGALYHELYFTGLTDKPSMRVEAKELRQALAKQFGSVEAWWAEVEAAADIARGWVATCVPVGGTEPAIFWLSRSQRWRCLRLCTDRNG